MSSTRVPPAASSAAVPSRPDALRAMSTRASTSASRLMRTAAARPMPWLAPVMTQTLPILAPAPEDVGVDRLGGDDVGRDGDLDVALRSGQDPDRGPGVAVEQAGVLGEERVVASRGLVGGHQRGPVELLRQLDVDQLVSLEQVLDVLVTLENGERDGDPEHRVRIRRGDESLEFGCRHEWPDGLVDDHRLAVPELDQPLVDRLLPRAAADDAAELVVEAVIGDEPPGLVEVRLGTGDDDPFYGRDDPRLLEHVHDERLAAEQQELLGERAPDALPDAPGEHHHADLHAVPPVVERVARALPGGSPGLIIRGMSDSTPDAGIELVSIRWVRVQVIIDARVAPGTAIDPGSFDLRLSGHATRFPPTHATIEDGRVSLRYNVMNGP